MNNTAIESHLFPYEWTLKNANFTKDKGTVFSCFSCGGGSTMGYKLAGFDVVGCNEIDPKMMEAYKVNHNPKYAFLESITTFKDRQDLPEELYNLDILDGSPPCSSFSMAGNREKDWGKSKKFREGQKKQVLDTLFFDFIDLAKRLQPKVVIAENVKGILLGNAKKYVRRIYSEFNKAGYYCQHFLLDASKMGVPQRRERVFFVCLRKDLAGQFLKQVDMFRQLPFLDLGFNEQEINFIEISEDSNIAENINGTIGELWDKMKNKGVYGGFNNVHPKDSFFGNTMHAPNRPLKTILSCGKDYHFKHKRRLSSTEFCKGGSYPLDYNFLTIKPYYVIGMSVPPVMTAQIATRIHQQWLSKI